MKLVFRQTQLYKFLSYCNNNEISLEKSVLDCGAGGNKSNFIFVYPNMEQSNIEEKTNKYR